jgi:FAD:protein FMN transferase
VRTHTFEAIGVVNHVVVEDDEVLEAASRIAVAEIEALDLACSRFRDDSELALLNREPGRPVPVSELLFDAVSTALEAAAATDGVVDPTVGRSLRGLGYDRSFEIVVGRGGTPRFAFVPAGGWRAIELDGDRRTIVVPRGYELDLGATAKALAADRIAGQIAAETGSAVLVSLGGDIAVAGAPAGGWPVLIAEDSRAPVGGAGPVVAVHGGGLATSSTTVRRWQAGEIEVHHVVDPRTGAPAAGPWRTVSVAAATCVEANTAATASIVLGDAALAWLESRGLAARLVAYDGSVVRAGGWPADG